MTHTTTPANLISAARDWILNLDGAAFDAFIVQDDDAALYDAASLSNENVFYAIARHYPGGWVGFLNENMPSYAIADKALMYILLKGVKLS